MVATNTPEKPSLAALFLIFLRLGLTSFGGPVAHLGYFRTEFVERRRWLDHHAYADLVALCQFLPGPASSQVGIALGLSQRGLPGALAAWLGFTLPAALLLSGFALLLTQWNLGNPGWLHGLKVVAVAVVAQALWAMGRTLCPDRERATLAAGAALVATLLPGAYTSLAIIAGSGLLGWRLLNPAAELPHSELPLRLSPRIGLISLGLFLALLLLLPLWAGHGNNLLLRLFASFYQAGALVFGGGHVVLPLLQALVVPAGWVDNNHFLAGYGAAQAMPGPLFTFAAYLGAIAAGWAGALIATIAIFLPGALLVIGALPLWENLRRHPAMQRATLGINAAVVGLLLAAFYNPVWTSGVLNAHDFVLALACFLALVFWKLPPWLVVILAAVVAGLGFY